MFRMEVRVGHRMQTADAVCLGALTLGPRWWVLTGPTSSGTGIWVCIHRGGWKLYKIVTDIQ